MLSSRRSTERLPGSSFRCKRAPPIKPPEAFFVAAPRPVSSPMAAEPDDLARGRENRDRSQLRILAAGGGDSSSSRSGDSAPWRLKGLRTLSGVAAAFRFKVGSRSPSETLRGRPGATADLGASLRVIFSSFAWRFLSAFAALSSSFFAFASCLISAFLSLSSSFSCSAGHVSICYPGPYKIMLSQELTLELLLDLLELPLPRLLLLCLQPLSLFL